MDPRYPTSITSYNLNTLSNRSDDLLFNKQDGRTTLTYSLSSGISGGLSADGALTASTVSRGTADNRSKKGSGKARPNVAPIQVRVSTGKRGRPRKIPLESLVRNEVLSSTQNISNMSEVMSILATDTELRSSLSESCEQIGSTSELKETFELPNDVTSSMKFDPSEVSVEVREEMRLNSTMDVQIKDTTNDGSTNSSNGIIIKVSDTLITKDTDNIPSQNICHDLMRNDSITNNNTVGGGDTEIDGSSGKKTDHIQI